MKIYGYKNEDVTGLINYLEKRKNVPLTRVFNEYAKISKKSKGTIRNLYYALAKRSKEDEEFRTKMLGGVALEVSVLEKFSPKSEEELVSKIISEKAKGRSVRSIINEMSGGNEILALRYQNKYRNIAIKNPEFIESIAKKQGLNIGESKSDIDISDFSLKRLKKEIDGLINRISIETAKENTALKKQVRYLEIQNGELKKLLADSGRNNVKEYFEKTGVLTNIK